MHLIHTSLKTRLNATSTIIVILSVLTSLILACNNNDQRTGYEALAKDSLTIVSGKNLFRQYCSGCHGIRRDGIGPKLEGVTEKASVDWLHAFIKDPAGVVASGDSVAVALAKDYKTIMPSFLHLKEPEINAIISYLDTRRIVAKATDTDTSNVIKNPIPDSIHFSGITLDISPVTQFPSTSEDGETPFARITKLDFQPGTSTLFVNDLRGTLYKINNGKPIVYMDFKKLIPAFINKPGLATGLGSFAFHPDFAKNKLLYTTHTESPAAAKADFDFADSIEATVQWVIDEWTVKEENGNFVSGTHRELFRINFVTGIHGVQEITFNPQSKPGDKDYGVLYIGIGDGGCVENDYPFLAHNKEKPWGTIFRVDPTGRNSSNGKYGIPTQNPFAANTTTGILKEIYAYGFRNPHRITWTKAGKMLVFNIGQAHIESINMVEPGYDFGWPLREGNFVSADLKGNLGNLHPLPVNDSNNHFTYPVAQYDHDDGIAISGGYEYLGNSIAAFKGKIVFGDIAYGRLFFVDAADLKQGKFAKISEWKIKIDGVQKTLRKLCGKDRVDLHFGRDAAGEIYILTKTDGKMYKLIK